MPIVSAGNDCGPPMRLDDSRDRERLDQVGELKTHYEDQQLLRFGNRLLD